MSKVIDTLTFQEFTEFIGIGSFFNLVFFYDISKELKEILYNVFFTSYWRSFICKDQETLQKFFRVFNITVPDFSFFFHWIIKTLIPYVDKQRENINNYNQKCFFIMDNCSAHESEKIDELLSLYP